MKKPENSADQPLVMIIDDDATIRMQATGFLSQAGFRVAEAENGDVALQLIDEIAPDLILLDVEMPGLNGFELCRILRQNERYAVTPVMMLTGLENDEVINRAYDVGATDFATKPIKWSLLSHRLRYMHRGCVALEQLAKERVGLAKAQRIAQLGSWEYDLISGKTEWSGQLFRMLGLGPDEVTPSWPVLLEFVHPDDLQRVANWFEQSCDMKDTISVDHRIVPVNNCVRSVRQKVEPEFDKDGTLVRLLATVQDFTERKEVENKVKQLAYYDPVTNLPNRFLFHENLEKALEVARLDGIQLAILYFDLDDFKRINDSFGHAMGDRLLKEVGVRLGTTLDQHTKARQGEKPPYTIARMGGDEFIIILNHAQNPVQVEGLAKTILHDMALPFNFDSYELFTSLSIGIAIYPQDGECAEVLLKNSDIAMYEAKRVGKKSFKIFNRKMHAKALKHYEIDAQMRTALERNEFSVHYQPQLDLLSGEIYCAEALLRWENQSLGVVSPADFIPVAEDNGLILTIGHWVLQTACAQAAGWIKRGFAIPSMAVNISALQFMQAGFPDVVRKVLLDTALPADKLELEITESLLASDTHQAVATLSSLNEIGVKLSIDDFGTGYSSLSQLKNFPIHRLKIDQSFIRNVTEDNDDAAITRAVIAMSKNMNIRVVAEGVETIEQFDFLRANGCDEVQGYFVSQPKPADQIEQDMPSLLEELSKLYDFCHAMEVRKAS